MSEPAQNNQHSELIKIGYSDIYFDKTLKLASLLHFFQDIAGESAEKLGFGYGAVYPHHMLWFLLKYRIEFTEYPENTDQLKLITRPRGYNRFFAYRNFQVFHQDKLLARASSTWALVNFQTKEMINIETVASQMPALSKFIPDETDLKYEKIPPITRADFTDEFKVLYADIDINMHANNANYITWALEPLPYEFRQHHKLKSADIQYKKEIKYGEKLISQVQVADATTLHILKNAQTNEDLCALKCEWK